MIKNINYKVDDKDCFEHNIAFIFEFYICENENY